MAGTVLIVDDDHLAAEFLRRALAHQRIPALVVPTARDAQAALSRQPISLALLDVALPDASGFAVARWLRQHYAGTGIIFVTGHTGDEVRTQAFQSGADDFLTKPIMLADLLPRLRAVLARYGHTSVPQPAVLRVGRIAFDPATNGLQLADGRLVTLTHSEGRIIATLLAQPGQFLDQATLIAAIWPTASLPGETQAALELLLRRLSAKIEPDPAHPQYLRIVPGAGAQFLPWSRPRQLVAAS